MGILRQFRGVIDVPWNSEATLFQQAKQFEKIMSEGKPLASFQEDGLDTFLGALLGFKTEISQFYLWVELARNL